MSLKESLLPLELTGLTLITKPFPSTSPRLITNVSQLGLSRHLNTSLYHQSLILTDSGHLSKTLTTLRPKPVTPFPYLMSLSWKPKENLVSLFCFSFRGNVTESTIVAIIPLHDVGYYLLGFPSNTSFLTLYLPDCSSFLLDSTFHSSLINTFCSLYPIGKLYALLV